MLRILEEDLLLALADGNDGPVHYLDRESGAVIPIFREMFAPGDDEYIDEREFEDDPRYVRIEPVESHEAYDWMERFAADVSDAKVQSLLRQVLSHAHPFRGFKDVLLSYPGERQAWFTFEAARQLEAAREWLESEGIEAELVSAAEGIGD